MKKNWGDTPSATLIILIKKITYYIIRYVLTTPRIAITLHTTCLYQNMVSGDIFSRLLFILKLLPIFFLTEFKKNPAYIFASVVPLQTMFIMIHVQYNTQDAVHFIQFLLIFFSIYFIYKCKWPFRLGHSL